MNEDQQKVYKWFVGKIREGKDYEESLQELFKLRQSTSKYDQGIYETFCFMDDEDWFVLKEKLVTI